MNNNPYELYHFGILGMKWGIRRYQNEDGSLTPEGKLRYGDGTSGDRRASNTGSNNTGSRTYNANTGSQKGTKAQSSGYKAYTKKGMDYAVKLTNDGIVWGATIGAVAGAVEARAVLRKPRNYAELVSNGKMIVGLMLGGALSGGLMGGGVASHVAKRKLQKNGK